MLLIGDKVVNASPNTAAYPHQLDLGEAWKELTGLPFVFAMWIIRHNRVATEGLAIARILDEARRRGADIADELLDRYAAEKGWPRRAWRIATSRSICTTRSPRPPAWAWRGSLNWLMSRGSCRSTPQRWSF